MKLALICLFLIIALAYSQEVSPKNAELAREAAIYEAQRHNSLHSRRLTTVGLKQLQKQNKFSNMRANLLTYKFSETLGGPRDCGRVWERCSRTPNTCCQDAKILGINIKIYLKCGCKTEKDFKGNKVLATPRDCTCGFWE